jgi:hypothetical protein
MLIKLQGLPLPHSLDPGTAAYIAAAYAAETRNIIDAEAFIAERRYRQQLMAAQSLRIHMINSRKSRQDTNAEVARFRMVVASITAGRTNYPELVQARYADQLFEDPNPSDIRRYHGEHYAMNIIKSW